MAKDKILGVIPQILFSSDAGPIFKQMDLVKITEEVLAREPITPPRKFINRMDTIRRVNCRLEREINN